MKKEGVLYLIGLILIFNLFLLYLIAKPSVERIRIQIEQGGVIEVGVSTPLFHDYFYDYILESSEQVGDWHVDTYREVKVLLDERGKKITQVETGNKEFIRYWMGE